MANLQQALLENIGSPFVYTYTCTTARGKADWNSDASELKATLQLTLWSRDLQGMSIFIESPFQGRRGAIPFDVGGGPMPAYWQRLELEAQLLGATARDAISHPFREDEAGRSSRMLIGGDLIGYEHLESACPNVG